MLSAYTPVQLHTPTTATATRPAAAQHAAAFSIDEDEGDDSTLSTASDSEHASAATNSTSMPPQRAGEANEQVAMLRVVSMYNGDDDVIVDAGSINGTGANSRKLYDGSIGGHSGNGRAWGTQLCISALSAISGFLFGYDLCVMVIALPLIQGVRVYTSSLKCCSKCVAYLVLCMWCVYQMAGV